MSTPLQKAKLSKTNKNSGKKLTKKKLDKNKRNSSKVLHSADENFTLTEKVSDPPKNEEIKGGKIPIPPPPPLPKIHTSVAIAPEANTKPRTATDELNNNQQSTYSTHIETQTEKEQQNLQQSSHLQPHVAPSVTTLNSAGAGQALSRWCAWRKQVNDQLSSHILSQNKKQDKFGTRLDQLEANFTEGDLQSIHEHAQNAPPPVTSLDGLSYVVYGIPRAQMRSKSQETASKQPWRKQAAGKYILNSSYQRIEEKPLVKSMVSKFNSENETRRSTPALLLASENLFLQTKTPSNIARYLPTSKSHPNLDSNPAKSPKPAKRNEQEPKKKEKQKKRNVADRLQEHKALVQERRESEDASCTSADRARPPVVGGVPTILSGLRPYDMQQLRRVGLGKR